MKKVMFLGAEYEVEDKYNYVAMDPDGDIYAFEKSPTLWESGVWGSTGGRFTYLDSIAVMKEIK